MALSRTSGVAAEMLRELDNAFFGGFESLVFLAGEGIIAGPVEGGRKRGFQET